MDFLELCQKAAELGRTVGRAPTAVTGQTGRQAMLVASVAEAWRLVQMAKHNWLFMKGQWTGALTIGQMTYVAGDGTGGTWNIPRFGEWIGDYRQHRPTTLYDPATGQADEGAIAQISWERWRRSYDIGVHDALRPHEYCLAPDSSFRVGPKPDKAYVARGEYRKAPQILADDDDVPDVPERFHMIIVYRALMLMAEGDVRVNGVMIARGKFAEMNGQMVRDLLPSINVRAERPMA